MDAKGHTLETCQRMRGTPGTDSINYHQHEDAIAKRDPKQCPVQDQDSRTPKGNRCSEVSLKDTTGLDPGQAHYRSQQRISISWSWRPP